MNIYARAHTADWLFPIGYPEQAGPPNYQEYNWKLGLDVTAWFMQATDDEILALTREELGGGPIGERVMDWLVGPANSPLDPRLLALVKHAEYMQRHTGAPQRELYVDVTQIIPWLGEHRPHLVDPVLEILEANN